MNTFSSFTAFQDWLKISWLPSNTNAAQLDGQLSPINNPNVVAMFTLVEIPNLITNISLHGDTTIAALRQLSVASIYELILVPPQPRKNFWRLHFKRTHNYANDAAADGLFAYVK